MKRVLLLIVMVSMFAYNAAAQASSPRWVIVLTVNDRLTGELVMQHKLKVGLAFDDLQQCQLFVRKVGPVPPTEYFVAVLTCREIQPTPDAPPGERPGPRVEPNPPESSDPAAL